MTEAKFLICTKQNLLEMSKSKFGVKISCDWWHHSGVGGQIGTLSIDSSGKCCLVSDLFFIMAYFKNCAEGDCLWGMSFSRRMGEVKKMWRSKFVETIFQKLLIWGGGVWGQSTCITWSSSLCYAAIAADLHQRWFTLWNSLLWWRNRRAYTGINISSLLQNWSWRG